MPYVSKQGLGFGQDMTRKSCSFHIQIPKYYTETEDRNSIAQSYTSLPY